MNKAISLLLTLLLAISVRAEDTKDLNLIVLVVCTLRADHLPFYGYEKNTAPFLNELSKNSAVFENVFSTSAWTAPSTASIHSGVYPFQHGVVSGMAHTLKLREKNAKITLNKLPAELDLLAEVAKQQGYRTFAVTDNLNIVADEGFDAGFDRFQNFNYLSAKAVADKVNEWEADLRKAGKYLLYLNFMDPHYPYHKRAPWFPGAKESGEAEYVKPNEVPVDGKAAYDSEISFLDHHIKALADKFGWLENSIVVLVGDHGEEFNEHGRYGHGQTLYQEILHVPLMIYYPKLPAVRVAENVSSIDILPTVRELLGAGLDSKLEGRSLLPQIKGAQGPKDRPLFAHLQRLGENEKIKLKIEAMIKNEWKLIRSTRKKTPELYNLEKDPGEKKDLYSGQKKSGDALLAELERFLLESRKFSAESVQIELNEESLKRLKSLGYLN